MGFECNRDFATVKLAGLRSWEDHAESTKRDGNEPLVIISGPVGAGKTTVALELVASSPPPVAYIEGDKFWFFIAKGAGRRREKDFKMIMTAMTAAALPYALYGYEVILDFSIPPWFLETAQRVVKWKDLDLDYVVLRPSETVCAARAAGRAEARLPITRPIVSFIPLSTGSSVTPFATIQAILRWSPRASEMVSTPECSVSDAPSFLDNPQPTCNCGARWAKVNECNRDLSPTHAGRRVTFHPSLRSAADGIAQNDHPLTEASLLD